MYRVELKDDTTLFYLYSDMIYKPVPNVPCGVESRVLQGVRIDAGGVFLMYRVELKVFCKKLQISTPCLFLMYRVELKDSR